MPARGVSVAAKNRKIRQDALREQLQAYGLIGQVLRDIEKLDDLGDPERVAKLVKEKGIEVATAELSQDATRLAAIKSAMDGRMKLLNKILPDARENQIVEQEQGIVIKLDYTGLDPEDNEPIEGQVEEVGDSDE